MKQAISYKRAEQLAVKVASGIHQPTYSSLYGVQRGGVPVALMMARFLNLELVEEPQQGTLIVDDIADSGRTLKRFAGFDSAVLFHKPRSEVVPTYVGEVVSNETWVEFPWEAKEAPGEDAVLRMLEAIGEDPTREGLQDTPKRITKSWTELYKGYKQNPKEILTTRFATDGYDQMVLLKNIEMYSVCEHHGLPFFGKAHVAYIPGKRVVGLSKLARLVECFSRRMQIQERLTRQIVDALVAELDPIGAACVIEAQHFCMVARGVNKQAATMTTSAVSGAFRDNAAARTEFMDLIKGGKNG